MKWMSNINLRMDGIKMNIADMVQTRLDGTQYLYQYTSVGCYTLLYYDKEGNGYCADCAWEEYNNPDVDERNKPLYGDTYDEGPSIFCCVCNKEIESSYGYSDIMDLVRGMEE